MKYFKLIASCFIFFFATNSYAQVTGAAVDSTKKFTKGIDSTLVAWMNSIVYLESVYQRSERQMPVRDTLTGTGFLIADGDKVYMVTARHVIIAALNDENAQSANDSVFIKAKPREDKRGLNLTHLFNADMNKMPVVFSSNEDDMAIISFQKKENTGVLSYLLSNGYKPVPIELIDTMIENHKSDWIIMPSYSAIKGNGGREIVKAISLGQVKSVNKKLPVFTIDDIVHQGNNGAPVISKLDNKIIGVLRNEANISTNADILKQPYYSAKSATIVKSSYILPLLRKLQENEKTPGFN